MKNDKMVSADIVEFNPELGDPVTSIKHVKEVFGEFFEGDESGDEYVLV